jgi:lipoprotein signal peptidase
LSSFANITLHRVAVTFLLVVCWYVSTSSPWRPAFLFLAAGAAGNLLSLLLPPFAIVDFLYSKFVTATIGYQVFNVADMYYALGLAVFPAFVIRWIVRQARAARDLNRA